MCLVGCTETPGIPDVDLVLGTNELHSILTDPSRLKSIVGCESFLALTHPSRSFIFSLESSIPLEASQDSNGPLPVDQSKSPKMEEEKFTSAIPTLSSSPFVLKRSESLSLTNLTSNDYVESVARCIDILKGGEGTLASIESNQKRNKDFIESSIKLSGGSIFSFARVYGFRNIQNLVRSIKQNKATYQFIEIMACPSGCLGGGAQLKGVEPSFNQEPCQTIKKTKRNLDTLRQISEKMSFYVEYKGLKNNEASNPLKIEW
jgi:iron only hydrogenase large subunit-like protein